MKGCNRSFLSLKRASLLLLGFAAMAQANIELIDEIKITDIGLFFNGEKVANNASDSGNGQYDYLFGQQISAHGDSVKVYKNYVFMTWYRGGKYNRHVMLSRYNRKTGKIKSIQLPHTHTGFQNKWWIGESHNSIAVAISPKDESIHLLYDMHAYSNSKPSDGSLSDDYFRYSYTFDGAASVVDSKFNLDLFKQNKQGGYKHLTLTGELDHDTFSELTYPTFFQNTQGDLLVYMRKGGNNNGGYQFATYDSDANLWSSFEQFNVLNAKHQGQAHNWGVYGAMKFVNGKLRVGFQRRSGDNKDKYLYQNGFYYAYSDDPSGKTGWKTHTGEPFSIPLIDADIIKIAEPGDLISQDAPNSVHMVQGFDWTVSDTGDIHFIGAVKTTDNRENVKVHTYKKAGTNAFITSTDFSGAEQIYTSGNQIYIIGLNSKGRVFIEMAKSGTNDFTRVYEAKEGPSFRHGVVHIENDKIYYYLQEKGQADKLPLYLQIIDLKSDTSVPEGFKFASTENQLISIEQPVDIAFGAKGNFVYKYNQKSSIECSIDVLGNPNTDQKNYCYTREANPLIPQLHFEKSMISLTQGYKSLVISVEAMTAKPDAKIESVQLWLNNKLIRQEKVAPYIWGDNKPAELLGLQAGEYKLEAIAIDSDGMKAEATMKLYISASPSF